MNIGDMAVVKDFSSPDAYGRDGRIKEFDPNVLPGEMFAVLDIAGVEYCFNVKDLAVVSK